MQIHLAGLPLTRILSAIVAIALSGAPSLASAAERAAPAVVAPPLQLGLVARVQLEDRQLAAARQAILELERADPGLRWFFDHAPGYAVFATVRSVAGVAGASGAGVLFEEGRAVGLVQLTQAATGLGPDARVYSEVVFLENAQALTDFKDGDFAMGTRVPSRDVADRASAKATYAQGLTIFTLSWVGSQAADGLDGQRIAYRPVQVRLAASAR